MKPTIDLQPIFHRNGEQIGIYFKNNLPLDTIVRKDAGAICGLFKLSGVAYIYVLAAIKTVGLRYEKKLAWAHSHVHHFKCPWTEKIRLNKSNSIRLFRK